jgi:hypothetical protein
LFPGDRVSSSGPAPGRQPRRFGALLILLLQLSAAATLPVADGRLRNGPAGAGLHLESPADADCNPGHDHLFCQLCRAISLAAHVAAATVPERLDGRVVPLVRPGGHLDAPPGFHLSGPLGPRAPPSLA